MTAFTGGWVACSTFGALLYDAGVHTGPWPPIPPNPTLLPVDASEIDYYVGLPNPDGVLDHLFDLSYPTPWYDAYTYWTGSPGGATASSGGYGAGGDFDPLMHLFIGWWRFDLGADPATWPQPSVDAPDLVPPGWIGGPGWTYYHDLSGAVVVVVPTGTAADEFLTAPELDFTATATFLASPGLPLDDVSTSVADVPTFALHASGQLSVLPPDAATSDDPLLQRRVLPRVTVDLPTPAIVAGRPSLPEHWGITASSSSAHQGSGHIHAIADPDPHWDPVAGGWAYPPPPVVHHPTLSGAGDARWTVRSMPDPSAFPGGYYWVGEPSSWDGTAHIASACRQWAADASTPGAPSWHSIYPYKPRIQNHVHYGAGGRRLTVTAGMRFNLHFVEHMWLDWGHAVGQPFTWVIAGLVMDYPTRGYRHNILDTGRDPRQSGIPFYNENQVQVDRGVHENFTYRNALSVDSSSLYLASRTGHSIRTSFPSSPQARMFFGVFAGTKSIVGNYSPHGKYHGGGSIAASGAYQHTVIGRQNGWLGLNHASHLVVFEIRMWHAALDLEELEAQYGQLSSTWRFHEYH